MNQNPIADLGDTLRNRAMRTTRPAPVAETSAHVAGFGLARATVGKPTSADVANFNADYQLKLEVSVRADKDQSAAQATFDRLKDAYGKAKPEDKKAMQPEYDGAQKALEAATAVAKEYHDAAVKARTTLDDARAGKLPEADPAAPSAAASDAGTDPKGNEPAK